jgi:hypothetical protein
MCPIGYYQIMRNCTDKKQHRYQMVIYAEKNGVKPAARVFNTSPPVVRKWRDRYRSEGYPGLKDKSCRPLNSPKETPKDEKRKIVELRKKYKRMGAVQVKRVEELEQSAVTIRKIWREAGVSRRRRRKKYKTKQNLREVKKRYKLYEKACEDTKDLDDIPEYYIQMKKKRLPVVQYTHREVSTGIQFLGFGDERSLTHATAFAKYINNHLERHKLLPGKSIRQTDNGSEYIGSWNAKKDSSYTKEIDRIKGQKHSTIFPGAKTCQSDVETAHNMIEQDFYEIERFADRGDFFDKVHTYQTFFNFERPNTYKENKTPWELAKAKNPRLRKEALMLPPLDLEAAVRNMGFCAQGGNDVLLNPIRLEYLY